MHQMKSTPSNKTQSAPLPTIERQVVLNGRRNNQCWFSPSIAAIPTQAGMQVVINAHQLTGNDCGPMHTIVSEDMGQSWSPPFESQAFHKIPMEDDVFETVHTIGLLHHRKSGRTFTFGGTHFIRDNTLNTRDPRFKNEWFLLDKDMESANAVAFWDQRKRDYTPWRRLEVPQFRQAGQCPWFFGLNQCCEMADGSILMPLSAGRADKTASVTTIKLQIDGDQVKVTQAGSQIGHKLYEPSIVEFEDRFHLTIRSEQRDGRMYHSTSTDGLTWSEPIAWQWDDGMPVETANTQQHWMKLGGVLYLVYTRKSELNNGVFRYRAPLYMAQVRVTDRPRLVRESEQIVFPEKGARMGNFSVCSISEEESWIVTGEWLQQWIEGYRPDQFAWVDSGDDPHRYNRLIYRGDLLLAKVRA